MKNQLPADAVCYQYKHDAQIPTLFVDQESRDRGYAVTYRYPCAQWENVSDVLLLCGFF